VTQRRIGIVMHGVTGRMGMNQHLIRSILEIRKQGGVALKDGVRLMPDPILVGRSEAKLAALATRANVRRFTTNLDSALADPANQVYFDATLTGQRPLGVRKAIAAKIQEYLSTGRLGYYDRLADGLGVDPEPGWTERS